MHPKAERFNTTKTDEGGGGEIISSSKGTQSIVRGEEVEEREGDLEEQDRQPQKEFRNLNRANMAGKSAQENEGGLAEKQILDPLGGRGGLASKEKGKRN